MTTADPTAPPHPWAPLHQLILFQHQHQLPTGPVSIDERGNLFISDLTVAGFNAWYHALEADGAEPGNSWTDAPAGGKQRITRRVTWRGGRVFLYTLIDADEPGPAVDAAILAELEAVAS